MQAETASMSTLFDLTKEFGKCTIDRAGRVIDLGEEGAPETVEKEGAHWWRVPTKSARISFNVSFAEAKSTIDLIDLRYAQATAKRLEVRLNGKRVGMFELKEKSARVSATVRDAVLRPGKNEIEFHLGGVPKGSDATHLLLDWLRLGRGGESATSEVPTRASVVRPIGIEGTTRSSLVLSAPTTIRCTGLAPSQANLSFELGTTGKGEGTLTTTLLRDRSEPIELGRVRSQADKWIHTSYSIPAGATLGAIEFTVVPASPQKPVYFAIGEPRIELRGTTAMEKPAIDRVIVAYLGSTSASFFAEQAKDPRVRALIDSMGLETHFEDHRTTGTYAHASVASLLTSHTGFELSFSDTETRLPDSITMLSQALRDGGIATSMVSSLPLLSASFGFDRGWDHFFNAPAATPNADLVADAFGWLEKQEKRRAFLLLHLRGAHPPWDLSSDALKTLAPPDYVGPVDPKRAGELLSRARRVPPTVRLTDADRIRVSAFAERALLDQLTLLASRIKTLRENPLWARTLLVLTSDLGSNMDASIPFEEGGSIVDDVLRVPLRIHVPGRSEKTSGESFPTYDKDLGSTLVRAFGLAPPIGFGGLDLLGPVAGKDRIRPILFASRTRNMLRIGEF